MSIPKLLTVEDQHFLRAVFTPSWLSGLVIVLVALIVTGGAITTFSLNHSAFKQDLIGWEQGHSNSLSITGQSTQAVSPTLANSWPLIIVWAGVGLITYIVAASIVRFILETIEFRRQLDYVHADRISMLEVTVEHLVSRIVAAVLLLMTVLLFVYHLFPDAISAGRTSAADKLSIDGLKYAVFAFVMTAICTYFATVFLRLAIGKARVFSSP
jgi:hypothetical protein